MRIVLVMAACALAACSPAEETDDLAAGCDARAATAWVVGDAQYSVDAVSDGPDCARAIATIAVRDNSGAPLYAQAHLAQHIMVLAPAADSASMETALREWTDVSSNTAMQTSSTLPDWPARADAPAAGEFPFYPEPHLDREGYMALRQENVPLLCYLQGMESMACLALRDGELEKVGVQTFPG